jgi:hypothetical protein
LRRLVSVRQLELPVSGGRPYLIRVITERQRFATWLGHIELLPMRGRRWLRATRETSQPNMACIEYWATGLEPVYFEGVLERARRQSSHRRTRARRREGATSWSSSVEPTTPQLPVDGEIS